MTKKEKALIELEKKHRGLVSNLKNILFIGQLSFLKAGEILHKIRKDKTYKAEDAQDEWTWKEFCGRPDLPIPGKTANTKVRNAEMLIKIFKFYYLKYKFTDKLLGPVGFRKLDLIQAKCEEMDDKQDVKNEIQRAEEFTYLDLRKQLKDNDDYEELKCEHPESYPIYYCPHCSARSKQPLTKDQKEFKELNWEK